MADATTRVRIDTKSAEADLRKLNKAAQGSVGAVGGGGGGGGGRSRLGSFALGAAGGIAAGAFRSTIGAGIMDTFTGAFSPQINAVKSWAFKGEDIDALATREAVSKMPHQLIGSMKSGSAEQKQLMRDLKPQFDFNKEMSRQRLQGMRDSESQFKSKASTNLSNLPTAIGITAGIIKTAIEHEVKTGMEKLYQGIKNLWK